MKYLCAIAVFMSGCMLYSAEKDSECIQELNRCRAACYDKKDITGDCILYCYDLNSKCLKEKFK